MPLAKLTAEFVRSILNYDPETGIFTWRYRMDAPQNWNTRNAGKQAGYVSHGYVSIQIGKGANYRAHRLAWLHYYGEWPEQEIDHRFGVRNDNRISELRIADESQNAINKSIQSNNTSGHAGVSFHKATKKWRVRINKNRRKVFDNVYNTLEEAVIARNEAAIRIHGEFVVQSNANRPRYKHPRDSKKK